MRTRDTTVPRRRTPLTPRARRVPRWAVAAIGAAAFGLGLAIVLAITNSGPASKPDTRPVIALSPAAATTPSTPTPTVVLRQSGSGSTTTALFTTSGTWAVAYTYDCTRMGTGVFTIDEATATPGEVVLNGINVNESGTKGGDTAYSRSNGQRALRITSGCAWTVLVVDGNDG